MDSLAEIAYSKSSDKRHSNPANQRHILQSSHVAKAEGWLVQNPIVVTALNPLIGYGQGAELVKEAAVRRLTVHEVALERAKTGRLKHIDGSRPVSVEEIETALGDLRRLT